MSPRASELEDDDALMRRMADGQEAALAELMARWQAPIFRFIHRNVRDDGLAEELTQECFWRLWRARAAYRPQGRFGPWLYRIAARLCLDCHRRRARRPQWVADPPWEQFHAPPSALADRAAREAELMERLERALASLPPRQRVALELNRLEDMPYRDIARALGCSVGSVEQLIFRARQALRAALADVLPTRGGASGSDPPPSSASST